MSFQAYLDNIRIKTGKSLDEFKVLAAKQGFIENGSMKPGVKATTVTDWLKQDFQLGHGHAMALYAALKGKTA